MCIDPTDPTPAHYGSDHDRRYSAADTTTNYTRQYTHARAATRTYTIRTVGIDTVYATWASTKTYAISCT